MYIKINVVNNIVKIIIIPLFCFGTILSFGQGFSPYYTNTTYQKYLLYLQNSNKLVLNHPLSQPFTANELYDSLPKSVQNSDRWLTLLKKDIKQYVVTDSKDTNYKGELKLGAEAGNTNNYVSKVNTNDFWGKGIACYAYKNIGFYNSVIASEAYKRDTVYFGSIGKLENQNYARLDESYLKWDSKNYTLFAGRISRNFGILGENSLILSPASFSFDQFSFTFKNRFLKYTAIFSRLNDIYGYDIRDSIPVNVWNKRYYSAHRFEISITKKIEIAFTDVMLFGGKDAAPQFQYLSPVSILFLSKMTDRKGYEEGDANALMCFDFYYKPTKNFTFFSQFLIDDVDFTQSLRAVYPDRLGFSAKVIYTDLFPASQIYISYNRISNWTYNSFYTWGNYTNYGKSLGYPQNGTENLNLGMDVFKCYPFVLGFETTFEHHRLQDMNAPFVAVKTDFPIGIPEQSLSLRLNMGFTPNQFFSINLTTEFIGYNNYTNVKSLKQSFLNIYLDLKIHGVFSVLK